MSINQNLVEYYDELYPVVADQKRFYREEMAAFGQPVKLLRVGCGTGSFEHQLAKEGADVTGIESMGELLESANRKRRTQLMSLRFFQMAADEMIRFLGKGFYNIISMLDSRIILLREPARIHKLLADCKQLLTDGGRLVLSLLNFDKYNVEPAIELPARKSIRSALYARIATERDGSKLLDQSLETSTGRLVTVTSAVPVCPLTRDQLDVFAKDIGFKRCDYFADFARSPFDEQNSDRLVALLR